MTSELIKMEKERFNSLSQEDAKRIAIDCDGAAPVIRSCWYCNSSHEHLKTLDYFTCFACGISYVKSFPTPILGMRMRGEEITDTTMLDFCKALQATE